MINSPRCSSADYLLNLVAIRLHKARNRARYAKYLLYGSDASDSDEEQSEEGGAQSDGGQSGSGESIDSVPLKRGVIWHRITMQPLNRHSQALMEASSIDRILLHMLNLQSRNSVTLMDRPARGAWRRVHCVTLSLHQCSKSLVPGAAQDLLPMMPSRRSKHLNTSWRP